MKGWAMLSNHGGVDVPDPPNRDMGKQSETQGNSVHARRTRGFTESWNHNVLAGSDEEESQNSQAKAILAEHGSAKGRSPTHHSHLLLLRLLNCIASHRIDDPLAYILHRHNSCMPSEYTQRQYVS